MIDNNIMYAAFDMETKELADSYDIETIPEHKFSWRYKRRKRAIIKAYQRTLEKPIDFVTEYRHISVRQRIRFAVLVAVTALAATGAGMYVTHIIGGIMANQQSTHSDAFALDWESAPKTLEKDYKITYDLSDYEKVIVLDDDVMYWETYSKNSYFIDFMCFTKESYQNIRLNTEGSQIKSISINGKEVLYYITEDGGHYFVWDNGEYIFNLNFNIDYEEAIRIAESIEEYIE